MFSRILLVLAISASCAIGAGAIAKNSNHHNGHNALESDSKKHKDGKHQVGKHGKHTVFAEVKNQKVVGMSADGLMVRKVKSNKKMADLDRVRLAANGG